MHGRDKPQSYNALSFLPVPAASGYREKSLALIIIDLAGKNDIS